MLPKLEDLKVKPGESVFRAFDRMLAWARSFQLIKGDPRIKFLVMGGRGTYVSADILSESWTPNFRVDVSNGRATVGMGTVNGLDVFIDGVTLDGRAEGGRLVSVPSVKLSAPSGASARDAGSSLRSWVCLRVKVGEASGLIDPESVNAVTVVHAESLESDTPFAGLDPVALIKWSTGGKVESWHQIRMHNVKHEFVRGDLLLGRISRHIFSAT